MHPELVKMGVPAELLGKRKIYFDEDVDSRWAKMIGPAIVLLNSRNTSEPISLYLSSSGGNFFPGLDIYDMVRHSEAPVHGIVYQGVSSMATVILMACKKRIMFRHARVMIHGVNMHPTITEENWLDPEWQRKTAEDFRDKKAILTKIYAERTGQKEETIYGWLSKDTEFTAEKALAVGLIDEII